MLYACERQLLDGPLIEPWQIANGHGEHPPGTFNDRATAEVSRDRLSGERGGHHQHFQVGPDRLLNLPHHAKGQITAQRPLVEFVEDDRGDPL